MRARTYQPFQFALCLVLLVVASFPARAATVSFNFNGGSGLANSYTFAAGDVSVLVSATSWDGSAWRAAQVGRYTGGLGVTNSSGNDSGSPNHAVDNNGWDDMLIFQFSQGVDVNSIRLGWVSGDSDFVYRIGDTLASVRTTSGGLVVNGGSAAATYNLNSNDAIGTFFSIGAKLNNTNDYFKVQSMSVDYRVNVPDGGGIMLTAATVLAGAFVSQRRRRSKAPPAARR